MLEPKDKMMVVTMLEHGLTNPDRKKLQGSDPVLETLSAAFTLVHSIVDNYDKAMETIETVCNENSFEAAFEKFRNSCRTGETRAVNWL